jgi:hypothetical protein
MERRRAYRGGFLWLFWLIPYTAAKEALWHLQLMGRFFVSSARGTQKAPALTRSFMGVDRRFDVGQGARMCSLRHFLWPPKGCRRRHVSCRISIHP